MARFPAYSAALTWRVRSASSRALRFFFSQTTSVFSRKALGLFFGATASFLFGPAASFVFDTASFFGFRAQLSFNLGAQLCFFFSATTRLGFRLAPGVFFGPPELGLFREALSFRGSFHARFFTGLHALDFFFDGAEVHFSTATKFIFLRAFPSFSFQVVAFFFSAPVGLFLFHLP